ncbi:MAG: peptidoglycan-binding protein [Acidobacteria bacterium]|nr:peptidoglycan-binding protein [Acidobacteriota bacterium]
MSLLSPRFVSSTQLRNAAAGGVIRKGAKGRHVHLLQMALIDLGYPMPRSTGGVYSPDGDYGEETKEKVIAFQRANNLSPDGEVGRNTMGALDALCRNYKHRVKVHFRSISLTDVPFERSLRDAETVFGQYAIKFEYANGESLMLTPDEESRFNVVDGECNWVLDSGEYNELHSMGSFVPANNLSVYFVRRFSDNNLLGCGGHAPNRPACTVAANASRWDTAHEAAHVLLTSSFSPVHVNDTRNLMHPTASTFATIPILTDRQVNKIRQSVCCIAM